MWSTNSAIVGFLYQASFCPGHDRSQGGEDRLGRCVGLRTLRNQGASQVRLNE